MNTLARRALRLAHVATVAAGLCTILPRESGAQARVAHATPRALGTPARTLARTPASPTSLARSPARPLVRAPATSPSPSPIAPSAPAAPARLEFLNVPGTPGAYFFRPATTAPGRQRVLVYLHARNANPELHCRRWAEVARVHGWLLCPIGQVDRGAGRREWHNNRDYAHRAAVSALDALLARFPRRVRRHDNVILGFSEGAFVGMNVALMAPRTFPRWLIVAADDRYISGEGERIRRARYSVQRVYLMTGVRDRVLDRTRRAHDRLARVFGARRVRIGVLGDAGHELPPDMPRDAAAVLQWLTR